jgi:hypothetical protein
MGWETRRNGKFYFRKVREGKRVRSVFVGGGEIGRLAEQHDRERRAANRDERRERRLPRPSSPAPAKQAVTPSESGNFPRWHAGQVPYPVAIQQIEAAQRTGGDMADLIVALDVSDLTRSLLRRKFLN